jgi:hypothetical protein
VNQPSLDVVSFGTRVCMAITVPWLRQLRPSPELSMVTARRGEVPWAQSVMLWTASASHDERSSS